MEFLSQSDFARKHGVSPKTVTAWKYRGYLVLGPDGKRVNVAATERLLSTRTGRGGRLKGPAILDASQPGASSDNPDGWTLHEATRQERIAAAKLRQLELAEKVGAVADVAEVLEKVGKRFGVVRTRVLAIPPRLAPRLAVLNTAEGCGALLDEAIRDALTELATIP
jgi:hypothetical protein